MRSSASQLRLVGAAVLLFATTAPALAAADGARAPAGSDSAAASPAAEAAKPAKEERKICRADHATGSNLPKKICLTAREWRERSEVDFEK